MTHHHHFHLLHFFVRLLVNHGLAFGLGMFSAIAIEMIALRWPNSATFEPRSKP
jgi:hypothetical protein